MKQILQNLKNGDIEIAEVPVPQLKSGQVLIQTRYSLISAGTERMLLEFGKANLLTKAKQQPEKVKQALTKIKTDGLLPTITAIRNKLDQPITLGYCNVGEVIAIGEEVENIRLGQRVLSNGAHAECVVVPKNLCVPIPDSVNDEEAVFGVLGAIGLQGVRLLNPTLGEAIVVIGLGLIGLITVQLLRANGCRVLGIDFDQSRLALAQQYGAEVVNISAGQDPLIVANQFSRGRGVDGVLITAATKSNEPVHQAAQMCRKRGRIVLTGVVGLELLRSDFYEKELSFQVSCSYGPGRYDTNYEVAGNDYPIGFVRWTEQRNFEAILDMLALKKVDFSKLISHRFIFQEADKAYALLTSQEPSLGILLDYGHITAESFINLNKTVIHLAADETRVNEQPCLGVIGAGNYAGQVLIPEFKKTTAKLKTLCSSGGVSAAIMGKKFGFQQVTTDKETLLTDKEINALVIASRHDTHAEFVCQGLQNNKHVFVEKPLALTLAELDNIERYLQEYPQQLLMVGFNRRFSPLIAKIKSLLAAVTEPKVFIMTVNAGAVPGNHWTQDMTIGGGRIIGEVCHFIDLLRYLAGVTISGFQIAQISQATANTRSDDNVSIALNFADGSLGVIHYLANGNKAFSKERLELFCAGKILQLDNFRKLYGYGWSNFKKMKLWRQDKGQQACVAAFIAAIKQGKTSPIPANELLEVGRITIEIAQLINNKSN